jgi:hypothetical protein
MRARINYLRALKPDNPSYKLWLGDVVELANVQWGVQSAQMQQLREAIGSGRRTPDGEDDATRRYLERLDTLAAVLDGWLRGLGEPIPIVDELPFRRGDGRNGG